MGKGGREAAVSAHKAAALRSHVAQSKQKLAVVPLLEKRAPSGEVRGCEGAGGGRGGPVAKRWAWRGRQCSIRRPVARRALAQAEAFVKASSLAAPCAPRAPSRGTLMGSGWRRRVMIWPGDVPSLTPARHVWPLGPPLVRAHARRQPPATFAALKAAIPRHCFERSAARSLAHLATDLLAVALCVGAMRAADGALQHGAARGVAWLLYWCVRTCMCSGVFGQRLAQLMRTPAARSWCSAWEPAHADVLMRRVPC